ncbi:BgTH12-02688 [Blumeria graminis f. sp. triticale]|uniref:BgTH12-02688 n=1 Tax=Blumeria graminis f. sp. triticale TaxID=1689686 RepID=A0A9W4GEY6_BLUGR|nr:BgTH12-02688 [Blumeria graminis f. sp. triticale]
MKGLMLNASFYLYEYQLVSILTFIDIQSSYNYFSFS